MNRMIVVIAALLIAGCSADEASNLVISRTHTICAHADGQVASYRKSIDYEYGDVSAGDKSARVEFYVGEHPDRSNWVSIQQSKKGNMEVLSATEGAKSVVSLGGFPSGVDGKGTVFVVYSFQGDAIEAKTLAHELVDSTAQCTEDL